MTNNTAKKLHFRFCCSVWGACGITTHYTLEKSQKRAIRIITDSLCDATAKPLLRQLRLPSIVEMIPQESEAWFIKQLMAMQLPTCPDFSLAYLQ